MYFLDASAGYVAQMDGGEKEGWHSAPNENETYVPMAWSYDKTNTTLLQRVSSIVQGNINADGHLRTAHFKDIIKNIYDVTRQYQIPQE